jgi:hypothetical protein
LDVEQEQFDHLDEAFEVDDARSPRRRSVVRTDTELSDVAF